MILFADNEVDRRLFELTAYDYGLKCGKKKISAIMVYLITCRLWHFSLFHVVFVRVFLIKTLRTHVSVFYRKRK